MTDPHLHIFTPRYYYLIMDRSQTLVGGGGLMQKGGIENRGVSGVFFWGGKVIFRDFFPGVKCFFPVENSHFGRPKNKFSSFSKVKSKKKKKSPHLLL